VITIVTRHRVDMNSYLFIFISSSLLYGLVLTIPNIPSAHADKITFRFETVPVNTKIIVDNIVYTTPVEFRWDRWSEHKVTLPEHISIDKSSRYSLVSWSDLYKDSNRSIVADYDKDGNSTITYRIYYDKQYRLLVLLDDAREEWHYAGSLASIEVEPIKVIDEQSRLVFSSWVSSDHSRVLSDSNRLTVIMDEGLVIKPVYRKQYYLSVSADDRSSALTLGSGWYYEGAKAKIACISDDFHVWSIKDVVAEDIDYTSPITTLTVDRPYTIECILKDKKKEEMTREQALPTQLGRLIVLTSYGVSLKDGYTPYNSLVNINAKDVVQMDEHNESRYVFTDWSEGFMKDSINNIVMVDRDPKVVVANYKKQYSVYLNGKHHGWYDEGSNVELRCPKPDGSSDDVRYEFLSWEGIDGTKQDTLNITVDRAYKLSCSWKELYRVSIISPYKIEGSGFYEKGSHAIIYAKEYIDLGLGRSAYFLGFRGDVESDENIVDLIVDKPYRIVALWREDSTQQYIVITVLASSVVAAALMYSTGIKRHERRESMR
jgi:hypothetical protein